MKKFRWAGFRPVLGAVLALLVLSPTPAVAHPDQHGTPEGHLLGDGAWGDIELVGRLDLTDIDDLIADVAVSPDGNWAYLANWGRPTCAENSEAGGRKNPDAGAYVVDISDPANPQRVGFIPHHQDSRPGEGMQVAEIDTRFFSGEMLVMNSEQCGKNGKGGVVLWDVSDPRKPVKLATHAGDRGSADTNDTHSAFAWDAGERAYVVMVDNFEGTDVDILDITNPKRPRLVGEFNLNQDLGEEQIDQPELGLQESSLHDMVVKEIDGRFVMLLSYWDGGFVRLDVTDPTQPAYIDDTDYADPDPELLESAGISLPPEGNAHQAEFTADDRFFIGTDEDFSPYRSTFTIDTGDHAGEYPAGEFGFTPPVLDLPDQKLNGPVVYGGYGCPGDRGGIPAATTVFPSVGEGEERIVVFQRGPVQDPSASGDACFFSEKIESGQDAGYDAVVVANHHTGAQAGRAPDAQFCGGQGHEYEKKAPAVCIGHRAMHLLFGDEPSYEVPYAGSEPAIGTLGEKVSFTPSFDGWGYVHLFDADSGAALDTYAVDEAHDEDYAFGFGDLTVHEVATHPTESTQAYLAYYSAGVRSVEIECTDPDDTSTCELVETGSYLDPDGNDFWGVEVFERDDQTYVLASDRDSGLWVFRDTGNP